jgi:hypothetical protein
MKRLSLAVCVVGVVVGLGFYANRPKSPPAEPAAETVVAPASDEPRAVEPVHARSQQLVAAESSPVVRAATPLPTPSFDASVLSQTVDVLVSPHATYAEKQSAWSRLKEAGKLDQAITELEQRVANDPRTAEYPAALGQAYLQKCGTIKDVREQGILAMQADKVFDTALSLDPSNWEARFTKAVALSYWPPMLNKGEEVIQHFQTLIQQQELQAPQPQFASTYVWLGEQYQKAGRNDEARTIWQRGAALFPGQEQLKNKLASAP